MGSKKGNSVVECRLVIFERAHMYISHIDGNPLKSLEGGLSSESALSTPKFRCSSQPLGSAHQFGDKTRPSFLAASWQSCPWGHFWKGKGAPWILGTRGQKRHPAPQPVSITTAGQSSLVIITLVRNSSKPG